MGVPWGVWFEVHVPAFLYPVFEFWGVGVVVVGECVGEDVDVCLGQ